MNNKIKLEEEKKLILEELKDLGKKDPDTGEWDATPDAEVISQDVPDDADMADREEDYEEKSLKLEALEKRLSDINHALSLIENGGYGICKICGKNIESERLEANPSADKCEVCMEKVL